MSNKHLDLEVPVPVVVSPLSIEYFHGTLEPQATTVTATNSDATLLERASISSVLIARTTNEVVEPTNLDLGYRFKNKLPSKVKTQRDLQAWIQDECHSALDGLVASEPHLARLADRYEYLAGPRMMASHGSRPETRRAVLLFQQASSEPHAWLRIAAIAADYRGLRLSSSQAVCYLSDKLKEMQLSARRDMALQNVRGAVLEAADAFGTMLSPEDAEAPQRYKIMSSFVLSLTGHALTGHTFGELHTVEPDPKMGISLTERPEGFGPIKAARQSPIACPATYRFAEVIDQPATDNSALFRLLRAGISSMQQKELFGESLIIRRTPITTAGQQLEARLTSAGKLAGPKTMADTLKQLI